MKFKLRKDKPFPIAACIGIGVAVGAVMTLGLTVICAVLLLREVLSETAVPIAQNCVSGVSALAAIFTAVVLAKGKWIPVIGGTAGGYLALLLAGNAVLFDGIYRSVFGTVITVIAASVVAILVFVLINKRRMKGVPKYRFG